MIQTWNYDKPHRCPGCSQIWVYKDEWDLYGVRPRWWKTYTCQYCETVFTGLWAWFPETYYRIKFRVWFLYRDYKWRMKR